MCGTSHHLIQPDHHHLDESLPQHGSSSTATHPVHKTLASAANLANLLPTSAVLVFQTLIPSFSNNGSCHVSNKFLTSFVIIFCALCCFLSSFTDSFKGKDGKIYYGIATFKGLCIFNCPGCEDMMKDDSNYNLGKFKIRVMDFVHAFVSLVVFLVFAIGNTEVQDCFITEVGDNESALLTNLPLGAAVLSSFLFTIFPTTRRSIGYSDMA